MALTARQQEVVDLVCRQGMSYEQVADRLYVSRNTIKNHMDSAIHRSGSPNCRQLCYWHGRLTMLSDLVGDRLRSLAEDVKG